MAKTFAVISLLLIIASNSSAQFINSNIIRLEQPASKAKIGFYNTENLADTLRNKLVDDEDFTPSGRNRWNSEKYTAKLKNIARVIDDLEADVLGLVEIENESIVRDLMTTMKSDYNYIHRNTADSRGMDIVLIYKPSVFSPKTVSQISGNGISRQFLVVEGLLLGEPVTLIIVHLPSLLNSTKFRSAAAKTLRQLLDRRLGVNHNENIIVMGDFNGSPSSKIARDIIGVKPISNSHRKIQISSNDDASTVSQTTRKRLPTSVYTPFTELERKGFGTYVYRDRRFIYDYILLSTSFLTNGELEYGGDYGIFARPYMLYEKGANTGYPMRTFRSGHYVGGFSDHLPVYITLKKNVKN